MMRIILCEGKTDAILISYYLIRVFQCRFIKGRIPIKLPVEKNNEKINWYQSLNNPQPDIAIWAVGGYGRLKTCIHEVIQRNESEIRPEYRFQKIFIYFDRDMKSDNDISEVLREWLDNAGITYNPADISARNNIKCRINLKKNPPEKYELDFFAVVLPPDGHGALETFLLNALCDLSEADKHIVSKSKDYIAQIPNHPYLIRKRLREKACLGAVLSVFSPDWIFNELDKRLCSIQWENIDQINDIFELLMK